MTLVPPAGRGEEPDRHAGERELLLSWLDWHRATMVSKCEGLTPAQLGRGSWGLSPPPVPHRERGLPHPASSR